MEIDFKEFLPIGSVVLLNEAKKKIMVIGIMQINVDDERMYDYMGVLFPEGYVGPASCFLFNKADIAEVVSEGYRCDDQNLFADAMENIIKTVNQALLD